MLNDAFKRRFFRIFRINNRTCLSQIRFLSFTGNLSNGEAAVFLLDLYQSEVFLPNLIQESHSSVAERLVAKGYERSDTYRGILSRHKTLTGSFGGYDVQCIKFTLSCHVCGPAIS